MAYREKDDVVDDEAVEADLETTEVDDDDDDDIEILYEGQDPEPTEEETGPSKEELQAEYERLKAEYEQTSARASDKDTIAQGFEKLGKLLENQQNQQQQATGPSETWDDVKKRVGKNFYDDPAAAIEEMLRYAVQNDIAPAFQNVQQSVSRTALTTSKSMASQNDTNKLIMDEYGDEVEALVKTMPPGPDVYEQACQQVGAKHLTDLVAAQVKQAMSQQTGGPPKVRSNVNPSGRQPVGGRPKRQVRATSGDQAAANRMGMDLGDYLKYVKNA